MCSFLVKMQFYLTSKSVLILFCYYIIENKHENFSVFSSKDLC